MQTYCLVLLPMRFLIQWTENINLCLVETYVPQTVSCIIIFFKQKTEAMPVMTDATLQDGWDYASLHS